MIEPPVVLPPAVLPIERAAAALEVILCSGFPTQIVIITILSTFGMKARLVGGQLSPAFGFTMPLPHTFLLVALVIFFLRAPPDSARGEPLGSRSPGRGVPFVPALTPPRFVL